MLAVLGVSCPYLRHLSLPKNYFNQLICVIARNHPALASLDIPQGGETARLDYFIKLPDLHTLRLSFTCIQLRRGFLRDLLSKQHKLRKVELRSSCCTLSEDSEGFRILCSYLNIMSAWYSRGIPSRYETFDSTLAALVVNNPQLEEVVLSRVQRVSEESKKLMKERGVTLRENI